jgi:hypothetical protein
VDAMCGQLKGSQQPSLCGLFMALIITENLTDDFHDSNSWFNFPARFQPMQVFDLPLEESVTNESSSVWL